MKSYYLFLLSALCWPLALCAQTNTEAWSLTRCLDYAKEHSISIQQSKISKLSATEDVKKAKAAFAPSVSASSSQGFGYDKMVYGPSEASYYASYSVNANMTLFSGGQLHYSKKQAQIIEQSRQSGVLSAQKDIETSVLETYLQVLYAHENLITSENAFKLADANYERSKILYQLGKITKSDLAQIASSWSQENYNLTNSKNNLRSALLSLKQLLELGIESDFAINYPEIPDEEVLTPLPPMMDIYHTAMDNLPQVAEANYNLQSAALSERIAKSGWYPTLGLNAGLSSSYHTGSSNSLGWQFADNLGPSLGLNISVPIYDQRKTRSAVNKAKLETQQSQLNYNQTEKEVARSVESLYIDAETAQSNYLAAKDKLKYAEDSYQLVEEQFNVGMKNTVELLTERNKLLNARQELIQSRYQAVVSIQLLNIMQNKEIKVGNNN